MALTRIIRRFFFFLSVLSNYPINILRGNKVSFTSRIGKNSKLRYSIVGKYTYIARGCIFNNAKIGNYCSIAPNVQVGGMEHSYNWLSTSSFVSNKHGERKTTHIGNDVWIAAGSIIKQGVTIGDGAVIGAMSFVNRDVPANTVVVGIPAKVLKKRLPDDIFEMIKESGCWYDNPIQVKKKLAEIDKYLIQ